MRFDIFLHRIMLTLRTGVPAAIGRPRYVAGRDHEMAIIENDGEADVAWNFLPLGPGVPSGRIPAGGKVYAAWPLNVTGLIFWPSATGTLAIRFGKYDRPPCHIAAPSLFRSTFNHDVAHAPTVVAALASVVAGKNAQ
jgi:hypothetical protein